MIPKGMALPENVRRQLLAQLGPIAMACAHEAALSTCPSHRVLSWEQAQIPRMRYYDLRLRVARSQAFGAGHHTNHA